MDKTRQGFKSKIPRKSAVALVEPEIKLADKGRTAVAYQVMALLVFVALGFFIYSNTLKSPFFFDDWVHIPENPHIRITELDLKDITAAGFKSPSPTRPIANISFALNYYFHRYNVIGYHCTNIIIHILTGIFLYLFVKSTLSISLLHRRYHNYRHIAFLAALLWLVHPIQTQSVTYIVQRMNSMAAMFYILSLLLYVKGRLTIQEQKKSWPWFAGCILAGLLALGCKETAATLPVFILLYEWYFFQDLKTTGLRRYFRYVTGVFIIFGVLGLWYLGSSPLEKILSGYARRDFTLTERLLTQPRVVIYYISLLAYPVPGRLNVDHYFAVSKSLFSPSSTLPCIGAITGLIALACYMARKERLLSFCILWFFGQLAIESSVIGLELAFEHRLYLPSMFVSLAIVAMAWRFIKQNWVRVGVFCIVTLLCCGWTYERNSVWSDPVTLWKDSADKSPKKPRPHYNLAVKLRKQGKNDEAIKYYTKTLQLDPNRSDAHLGFGISLLDEGRINEAIVHFNDALRLNPDYAEAHHNMGIAFYKQDKFDEALARYNRALQINPKLSKVHNSMATMLYQQGEIDKAIAHWTEALSLKADWPEVHSNLAIAFYQQGKIDKAIAYWTEALRLKADWPEVHSNLATAFYQQGKVDKVIEHWTEALRLEPDWPEVLNNLAWILATHKDAKYRDAVEGLRLAKRACELTEYKQPGLLDTLAAAYASEGRFSQAIETAEKAVNFALSAGKKELAQQIQSRLQLYKAGQPHRELLPAPGTLLQTD